jgi:hypothetical protein
MTLKEIETAVNWYSKRLDDYTHFFIRFEFSHMLDELARHNDYEATHSIADDIMCAWARKTEGGELADRFAMLKKWYA